MNKNTAHTKQALTFAACLFELNGTAPTEIKLTPAGTFKAKDGRPGKGLSGWVMHSGNAEQVIAAANAQQDDFLIDYEHQTLYSRQNGQPAPAGGWFKRLEWREGDGLYATDVQWTEAAKVAIENKEYRYISPVLVYDKKTGEIKRIAMAALVNAPAIDGLEDLAAAHFDFNLIEDKTMDKAQLALLGLDENATPEQVSAAIVALKATAETAGGLGEEVAALKLANPDPAKYVPVETMVALKAQVDQLSTQVNNKEHSELLTAALSDGRLLPAQQAWAESLDVAGLKGYLENAQPIAALGALQTDGQTVDDDGIAVLSQEQASVCEQMGLDVDEYKKALGDT